MIASLIVIGMIALIAYLWSGQGLFAALLHLGCTVVAGAIAFAVWEPAAYALLGIEFTQPMAFTLGLVVPFLVALVVLRLITDKLITANLAFDETTDFVGGLLVGAVSATIAVGVLVNGVAFMRLPMAIAGYQAARYDGRGNLVAGSPLWLPADRLVATLYGMTSTGAFSTDTPLARRAPNLPVLAAMTRNTFEGKGRTSLKPADVAALGRYTVAAPGIEALLSDSFSTGPDGEQIRHEALDVQGNPYPPGSRIEGFVIRFESAAKEKDNKFVVAPGQVLLVALNEQTGESRLLAPVAAVSQGDAASLDLGRWRFDSDDLLIASVGGASQATFGVEFVVPQGFTPLDLRVRNVRIPVTDIATGQTRMPPFQEFASAEARDEAIRSRDLFKAVGYQDPAVVESSRRPDETAAAPITDPVRINNRLRGAFNISNRGGLEIGTNQRGLNEIVDGQMTFTREQLSEQGIDTRLRVDQFAEGTDTVLVQVDVSVRSPLSLLGKAVAAAQDVVQPLLVDNLGQSYEPVGYIHDDGRNITIRFTPSRPLRGLTEIPSVSRNRPNESVILLFLPSAGVQLQRLTLGSETLQEFDPPVQLRPPQR